MKSDLAAFLARRTPLTEESAVWGDGSIHLWIAGYLCTEAPPLDYVSSARGVVFRGDLVLAFRDRQGVHILPGGRREPGEALEETLRREVSEETDWRVAVTCMVGLAHFHHLTPMPPNYLYPYPDFLQIVYLAEAVEFILGAKITDDYVDQSFFYPLDEIHTLDLPPGERLYLDAAIRLRGERRDAPTA